MSAVAKKFPAVSPAPAPALLLEAVLAELSEASDLADQARAKYDLAWWLTDDPFVLAAYQLAEPVLLVPFQRLRRAVDLCLGERVDLLRYLDPAKLRASIFPREVINHVS